MLELVVVMRIPIEIIPSHVHLSNSDWSTLFGPQKEQTPVHKISQFGQHVAEQSVQVSGKLFKRSLALRVLGPDRHQTQVELTPTEAAFIGVPAMVGQSGVLTGAVDCVLTGPNGKISVKAAIIPEAHLHLSPDEAQQFRLSNGEQTAVTILLEQPQKLEAVRVRIHPTYRARLHVHSDLARDYWLTGEVVASLEHPAIESSIKSE